MLRASLPQPCPHGATKQTEKPQVYLLKLIYYLQTGSATELICLKARPGCDNQTVPAAPSLVMEELEIPKLWSSEEQQRGQEGQGDDGSGEGNQQGQRNSWSPG